MNIKPFESKVWLSSPTMHGPELEYMKNAFDTNWMKGLIPQLCWGEWSKQERVRYQ